MVHVEVLAPGGDGDEQPDWVIEWEGELIAVVAAENEAAAAAGVAALNVEYEKLEYFVDDDDLEAAQAAERTRRAGRPRRTAERTGRR